jgi:AcrR family transcriptional regulator
MELYGERGYERTTVAEIAERAGLTERTYFRHFPDKREVLFSGGAAFQEFLVARVDGAPPAEAPLGVVTAAFVAVAEVHFEPRRRFVEQRQSVIEANAELRERELVKMATLGTAMADALRRRGVGDPAAGLAAEAGIAVFRIAFEAWVRGADDRSLADHIRAAADELGRVTAARVPGGGR